MLRGSENCVLSLEDTIYKYTCRGRQLRGPFLLDAGVVCFELRDWKTYSFRVYAKVVQTSFFPNCVKGKDSALVPLQAMLSIPFWLPV